MQYAQIGATKDSWPSNTDGNESLESAVMFHLQNSLANDIERIIWGGNGNAVAGIQNGLIDKALASANTIKVTGQTIDATNVLGEIEKVYNAIPKVVLNDGEFDPEKAKVRIFVNMDIMRYLRQALSTVPTNYQVILPSFAIEGGKIFYMGVEIVVAGLPANTMFAASKDNIVFVTDLLSDTQEIRGQFGNDLKDEAMFYIKGAYRAAVGMVFEDEVVIYSV
jgi:predicted RNA-binding protein